jgi:hybrid cluster-associated redox disulfide protein
MQEQPITSDLIVADVLSRWPGTIPVFLQHRMSCVGCHISKYDTLAEVIDIYNLEEKALLSELNRAIQLKEYSPEEQQL